MFAELLIATAFQIGPFYEQNGDDFALRPLVAKEGEQVDVLWPLFTRHRDWWRFAFFAHEQTQRDGGDQFELMPFWFNGITRDGDRYAGLFPVYGHHPHFLLVYDCDFALWPLWMRYSMPRRYRDENGVQRLEWMRTNTVLFPFFSWRDDGTWSVWPLYGTHHSRESDRGYALWPLVNWAQYREDRDTSGAGYSWLMFPIYGTVQREREQQRFYLPPLFSFAATFSDRWDRHSGPDAIRIRAPWPIFEYETTPSREHLMVFPFYDYCANRRFYDRVTTSTVRRYGWYLVELYDHETRVFPFWVSSDDYFRLWPFWETVRREDGSSRHRFLSLFPVRHVPSVDRNWAKFWTFYESEENPILTEHSLFWGLIRWRTFKK